MIRLPRWLRSGPPTLPITVAGHGRVRHGQFPGDRRRQLLEYVDQPPPAWGLLFVLDARGRRWTLYSPDAEYTAMLAPNAHALDLAFDVFATKFPCWNTGWRIT
jgi:hypothetical protein